MKWQHGAAIIWATNMDDPASIRVGTVQKVAGEYLQYGAKPEDSVHSAFVFPAKAESRLREILIKRQALKRAYDESMRLIYELRNAVVRGDL